MIYLDSAATTLQKPPAVARAMAKAVGELSSPGRGGHRPAVAAGETVYRCRELAAGLFQMEDPSRVVFTASATHGLNIAIKSLVKPGDQVVISGYEHNAVTRPLHALDCKIRVAAGPLFDKESNLTAFGREITEEVSCVICTHVSNVFGFRLPVEEIADLCRERGVPLILDASQSAGVLPIRMEDWGLAYAAMPGHKGLYGPQGTGMLLVGRGQTPNPLIEGGTGSNSALQEMPEFLPDRLESGTHNVTGIAGLLEGLRFVEAQGEGTIGLRENRLRDRLVRGLSRLPGVRVFQDREGENQTGVVSFVLEGQDCQEVGEILGQRGIALRSGLHCAPLAHETAGTLKTGTIRASFSAFNTPAEADRLTEEIRRLSRMGNFQ